MSLITALQEIGDTQEEASKKLQLNYLRDVRKVLIPLLNDVIVGRDADGSGIMDVWSLYLQRYLNSLNSELLKDHARTKIVLFKFLSDRLANILKYRQAGDATKSYKLNDYYRDVFIGSIMLLYIKGSWKDLNSVSHCKMIYFELTMLNKEINLAVLSTRKNRPFKGRGVLCSIITNILTSTRENSNTIIKGMSNTMLKSATGITHAK